MGISKNKARQIFRKTNISYPKSSFFGKFGVLCFLETPVIDDLLDFYEKNVFSFCWKWSKMKIV